MIAVGVVAIAIVVLSLVVGAIQDAEIPDRFGQHQDQSLRPIDIILLVVGSLLVLIGVIRHSLDGRDRRER